MDKQKYFSGWSELVSSWVFSIDNSIREIRIAKPPMYNILFINDTSIPCNFFADILKNFFYFSQENSLKIVSDLRSKGELAFGRFTREVAEHKTSRIIDFARTYGYPFRCIMCTDQEYMEKEYAGKKSRD